jgi:hypothetical protein
VNYSKKKKKITSPKQNFPSLSQKKPDSITRKTPANLRVNTVESIFPVYGSFDLTLSLKASDNIDLCNYIEYNINTRFKNLEDFYDNL